MAGRVDSDAERGRLRSGADGCQAPRRAESFISEADRDATTPENAAFAAARRDHALRAGIWGWYDDDITETVPWGFDPAAITGPVSVWHGAQDRFVPLAHGRWLAATIPRARSHLLAGEGHYSLLEARLGNVVNDLLELSG